MKTIIAEKPSVAREIARIVGATKREEGYFEENLAELGVRVEEIENGLRIYPAECIKPCKIKTYDDHRVAMS